MCALLTNDALTSRALALSQDGLREKAYLSYPTGIVVDYAGNVFVADSGNNRIRRVSANGDVTSVAGSGTAGFADDVLLRAEFNKPQSLVVGLYEINPVGPTA